MNDVFQSLVATTDSVVRTAIPDDERCARLRSAFDVRNRSPSLGTPCSRLFDADLVSTPRSRPSPAAYVHSARAPGYAITAEDVQAV